MKKSVFKAIVAAVCVVAAGMGGMKAYNAGNQSESNMLLAENVEALSQSEYQIPCLSSLSNCIDNVTDAHGTSGSITWGNMVHK